MPKGFELDGGVGGTETEDGEAGSGVRGGAAGGVRSVRRAGLFSQATLEG